MSSLPAWNAESYDQVSTVQQEWGRRILAGLAIQGTETVLDAGCGTARLAEWLAGAVPQGRVLAVDTSAEMLEVARRRTNGGGLLAAVRLVRADLSALPFSAAVDLIFSNAVFHWIPDHPALFRSLFAALRPGGRLLAQCGGSGNMVRTDGIAAAVSASEPFAPYVHRLRIPYLFATPEDADCHLREAGFVDVEISLTPAPTAFPTREKFRDFVGTVILRPYLGILPEELRPQYVEAFVNACPACELDYVRLNLQARKPR
jgi:trans-aconitate 2-methyltransferase